jgi:peptidoglycan hydrolase CwlO-like protein
MESKRSGLKGVPQILVLAALFLVLPAHAGAATGTGDKVNQKLDQFEVWTKDTWGRFTNEMNRDLDRLERKLKSMRSSAGNRTNEFLDDVEKELKRIGGKVNDLGKEKEPKKEEARKIKADLEKVEKKLN